MRVATGAPLPVGWTGKTWACAQLADLTGADVLVFCDCDVRSQPQSRAAVELAMTAQGADVFSVFPRQVAGTTAERLLMPLIVDLVLCFLPFGLLRAPVPAAATAHGALLAFRRDAYEHIGGFAAVRTEIVEDIALARRTRRSGLRLGLALGGDVAQVRMYDGYRTMITGLGRGLLPVLAGSRLLLITGWLWHVLAYTVPRASHSALRTMAAGRRPGRRRAGPAGGEDRRSGLAGNRDHGPVALGRRTGGAARHAGPARLEGPQLFMNDQHGLAHPGPSTPDGTPAALG